MTKKKRLRKVERQRERERLRATLPAKLRRLSYEEVVGEFQRVGNLDEGEARKGAWLALVAEDLARETGLSSEEAFEALIDLHRVGLVELDPAHERIRLTNLEQYP